MKINVICLLLLFSLLVFIQCDKNEITPSIPQVHNVKTELSISSVAKVAANSVLCTGTIYFVGDNETTLEEKGICWDSITNPTAISNPIMLNNAIDNFSIVLSNLVLDKNYFVRAFIKINGNYIYGNQFQFNINSPVLHLDLITTVVSEVTQNSAVCSGSYRNMTTDTIFCEEKGLCWDTISNPTTDLTKKILNADALDFTVQLPDLVTDKKYFVRPYIKINGMTFYGNQIQFSCFKSTITIENEVYNVIRIGNQIWLKENLKVMKFNDGSEIPLIINAPEWYTESESPAYCNYNNTTNIDTIKTYGRLYNWFAVDTKKLCPVDWHVPSNDDWDTLINYLGGESYAGGKLMENGSKHWPYPNVNATNETGFTGLPGGYRHTAGEFKSFGEVGIWWSSSSIYTYEGVCRMIDSYSSTIFFDSELMSYGLSVRCVRDF